ncbi:MAG: acyl-CoA dehydrogenase C-terminal domain-containing protein [Rhizomicrobium sp.]
MPVYRAPLADYRFLLHEFFEVENQGDLPQFAGLSAETIDDVLSGAGKLCEEVLQPLNQSGDEEGCHYENGVVRTPKGFKDAYTQFVSAGWTGIGAPAEFGGSNLPMFLTMAVGEMTQAANLSFAMYPWLSAAACSALIANGAAWMKQHIVPRMVSGEWTGTMCLTEPDCGTDLRLMKTRAIEQDDGTYHVTGTKIFISAGEHDLADNIVHLVIAKIPDETGQVRDDLSTVNFFMVPKYLVKQDGSVGARNGVFCGGIEHKMGIRANATCVLNFDDAVAWRLGPKPVAPAAGAKRSASEGMKGMFAMMNAARIGVGMQGIATGDVAMQNALAYAQERRAGRALTGAADPDKPADLLLVHPDIRRMLLHGRAFVEGARAVALWTSLNMSVAQSTRPERETAAMLADLMTPVIKGFFTDMGFECANMAMQCYGGHGYIRDNGVEQFVRDGRIGQIYEGANSVQAMDLVGRKLGRKGGAAALALLATIGNFLDDNEGDAQLADLLNPVRRGLDLLKSATLWFAQNAPANPNNAGAGAVDYLRLMGIVVTGWMWARVAKFAQAKLAGSPHDPAFWRDKLVAARYWMERMLPECPMLLARIEAGSATVMAFEPAE